MHASEKGTARAARAARPPEPEPPRDPAVEAAWAGLLALSEAVGGAPGCRAWSLVPDTDPAAPWRAEAGLSPDAALTATREGGVMTRPGCPPDAVPLMALYGAAAFARDGWRIAHLGQSLDGRIATRKGASYYVTGPEDVRHNHRLRALADAVIVGAGTVACDDPRLTVRHCAGPNPVRVIVDADRRLGPDHGVFRDGAAPTLLLARADRAGPARHGAAETLGIPAGPDGALDPRALCAALEARGLTRLFVEGGGITVSRFLAAGVLDRLQLAVAPMVIGSGRPAVTLAEVEDLNAALRPAVRRFPLGADMLFDCALERAR